MSATVYKRTLGIAPGRDRSWSFGKLRFQSFYVPANKEEIWSAQLVHIGSRPCGILLSADGVLRRDSWFLFVFYDEQVNSRWIDYPNVAGYSITHSRTQWRFSSIACFLRKFDEVSRAESFLGDFEKTQKMAVQGRRKNLLLLFLMQRWLDWDDPTHCNVSLRWRMQ